MPSNLVPSVATSRPSTVPVTVIFPVISAPLLTSRFPVIATPRLLVANLLFAFESFKFIFVARISKLPLPVSEIKLAPPAVC